MFLDVTDTKGISFVDTDFDRPNFYIDTPSPMVTVRLKTLLKVQRIKGLSVFTKVTAERLGDI